MKNLVDFHTFIHILKLSTYVHMGVRNSPSEYFLTHKISCGCQSSKIQLGKPKSRLFDPDTENTDSHMLDLFMKCISGSLKIFSIFKISIFLEQK